LFHLHGTGVNIQQIGGQQGCQLDLVPDQKPDHLGTVRDDAIQV